VPTALGVKLPEKLATPPLIAPLPVRPVETLQALSLYSVKLTDPVGLEALWNVAVSPAVIVTPTVPVVGLATVVIDGQASPFHARCTELSSLEYTPGSRRTYSVFTVEGVMRSYVPPLIVTSVAPVKLSLSAHWILSY
jgi:hypothetical protein